MIEPATISSNEGPREEAASSDQTMPELIYIMGTGRTGTTILEVLLASNPNVVGVGELKHIFRDGFLENGQCACGKATRECNFWSAVLRRTQWNVGECTDNRLLVEALESHVRFPLLWAGLVRKRTLSRYKQIGETLFGAIRSYSGAHVVVDSSKYASRALALAELFPEKVKVLCITRCASGMLRAFRKSNEEEQRPKGLLAVIAYYLYVLTCMRLVRGRLKEKCLSVRFEDLNRDPQAVLREIENWSGYSLANVRMTLGAAGWVEVGHIVTGNRLRKKGKIRFEPSPEVIPTNDYVVERVVTHLLDFYRRLLGF